jgi:CheY-like chemotaxis protein
LVVEDDDVDVRIIRECLLNLDLQIDTTVVSDGAQAMDFLMHRGSYGSAAKPDIVLLDINLPARSGIDIVREIRNQDELRTLPVIVLSSSDMPSDITKAYAAGCSAYVVKPGGLQEFEQAMNHLAKFWFHTAALAE